MRVLTVYAHPNPPEIAIADQPKLKEYLGRAYDLGRHYALIASDAPVPTGAAS